MILSSIIFLFSILSCINCSTATQYIVKYVEEEEIIPSPEPVIAAFAFMGDGSTLYPTLGLVGGVVLAATAMVALCCRRQNQQHAARLDSGYSIV